MRLQHFKCAQKERRRRTPSRAFTHPCRPVGRGPRLRFCYLDHDLNISFLPSCFPPLSGRNCVNKLSIYYCNSRGAYLPSLSHCEARVAAESPRRNVQVRRDRNYFLLSPNYRACNRAGMDLNRAVRPTNSRANSGIRNVLFGETP